MALDPISALINAVGLGMQQDAAGKAASASGNNAIFQHTVGLDNLTQQNAATNSMLGISDQLLALLSQSGDEGKRLVDEIVGQQNQAVGTSGQKQVGTAVGGADARNALANALAARDVSQANNSTQAISKAATADRGDVFGNITYYDPRTGGMNTSLSAPETDIERGYTQAETGRLGALNDAIANARYGRSPSEDSIRSELTGLMTDANAQKMKDIQNVIGRQALRMGRGSDLPTLIKSIDDQLGTKLPQTLLDARNQAAQEYIARDAARRSGANADVQTFATPYATPTSLASANSERQGAIAALADAIAKNAALGQAATTTSGNRISSAADKGFNDILTTLGDTEKAKLGTLTSGNALRLNDQTGNVQRMIDALTQRENILGSGAGRVQAAYATGMGAANTANTANVSAIGKQAPNATILNNLADNLSITPDSSSKTKGGSNDDLVQKLVDAMSAG
jgi:hypothetical protein